MIDEEFTESENYKTEIEKLKKELEDAKTLADDRLTQLKYLQADFENYKKRFDREKEQIIMLANESLIKELIVILDDFDSAIKLSENPDNKIGFETMKKKFFDILIDNGLKQIESLGKKFNPDFHEVLCKEISEHEEDQIIEEIQKGYQYESKVIRPSKVKVSKNNKETLNNQNKLNKSEDK